MLLLLVLGTAGCQEAATVAVDCQAQLRVDDTTYTSYGFTQRDADSHATAEQAECDDTGQDADGSVYPAEPRLVETWRFAGYPSAEVLGVRSGGDGFEVYVADSLPRAERDRMLEEMGEPAS